MRGALGQFLGLGDHTQNVGIEAVSVAAWAGNGTRHHDGPTTFADLVLLRVGGDLLGLFGAGILMLVEVLHGGGNRIIYVSGLRSATF